MHICYLDESGDSQKIVRPTDDIQPMLVITGIFLDVTCLRDITTEFISLKKKYFPSMFSALTHNLDALPIEIKGCDIRKEIRINNISSPKVQHHFKFLDELLLLMNKYQVKMVSRIWVKEFNKPIVDKSVYTITTQNICLRFEDFLNKNNSDGFLIADFRDPKKNSYVSHSVFTKKFKQSGDSYSKIHELPTFGISDNHACLQICDILTSTIIYPIAAQSYCLGIVNNSFTHANYAVMKKRYSKRIRALQYHAKINKKMYWGISSHDPHNKKDGSAFF